MSARRSLRSVFALGALLVAMLVGAPRAHAQSYSSSGPSSPRSSGMGAGSVGLILLGGGLITAGPGITILEICKEGKPCHSDVTTALGWALAGPGIPPIAVGLLLICLSARSSSGVMYNKPRSPATQPLQFTATSIPAGAMGFVKYSF